MQAPEVTCPSCGAPVGAADSFCESCGTELAPPMVSAAPPEYEAECAVCSVDPEAPPGAITAEGFCETCGRKVPSGRDHSELDLALLAGVTDRGLRHARNEDAMALATADVPGGPVAIAVVCDGVSTSPRSDDASLAAAQTSVRDYKLYNAFAEISHLHESWDTFLFPKGMIGMKQNVNIVNFLIGRTAIL